MENRVGRKTGWTGQKFLKYLNRHEFVNHGHRKKTVRQNDKHVHKDDDKS